MYKWITNCFTSLIKFVFILKSLIYFLAWYCLIVPLWTPTAEIRFKEKMHRIESTKTTGLNIQLLPHATVKQQTCWLYTNKIDLETPSIPNCCTALYFSVGWWRTENLRHRRRDWSHPWMLFLCTILPNSFPFSPSASGEEALWDSCRAPGLEASTSHSNRGCYFAILQGKCCW